MSSPRHPLSMSSQYFSSLVCFEDISYPVSQYHLSYLSGPKPAPNPWGPKTWQVEPAKWKETGWKLTSAVFLLRGASYLFQNGLCPRRANLLGKHLMVSLKCEPCASTKSNELLVFGATAAALISTTSSMLHTAKLILFPLTKAKKKKSLLSILILQEDLHVQEKILPFP